MKLPRVRFTVRLMMVVVLVLAMGLGRWVHLARVQHDAVARIRQAGGWVHYDWQRRGDLAYDPYAEPPWPQWLIELLGVDYFANVVYVTFGTTGEPDDADLASVARLPRLERLELGGMKLTDAGIGQLGELRRLELLYLSERVSDAGLTHLRGLPYLRVLSLFRTQVSDAGLTHLKGLANLRELNLRSTRVTDAGVKQLERDMPRLSRVSR